jgi:hypothetical protein
MVLRLQAALLGLVLGAAPAVDAAPKGNPPSTPEASDTESLRRVGYRAPEGAHRVSRVYPSPEGDQVAFFEEQADDIHLVVAVKGGVSARWSVTRATAKLQVYWVGPTEVILGDDVLAPKARVRWYVARAS